MKTLLVNRSVKVSILAVMLLIYGLQGTAYGQDAPDTVVEFSDVSLARIVRATLRLNVFLDDVNLLKIPKAEVAKLTILSGSGVQDLTGLEHATELKELYLRANRVSDLTPLSGLTQLRELDFWGNRIIDITPLSGLTELRELDLGGPRTGNDIVDLTPLTRLTQLRELNLSANEIRDITPLSGLTELTELNLFSNEIRDISALARLTRLTELSLAGNQIQDITSLAGLTKLTLLTLTANQVSDLTPLARLTELTLLHLGFNQVSDITPLAQMKSLTQLLINHNQISDVTPLGQLVALKKLNLSDNEISDVMVLAQLADSLTDLDLRDNQIRDVSPLAKLTNLEKLSLRDNPISDTVSLSTLLDENPNLDIDIEVDTGRGIEVVSETGDLTVTASTLQPLIGKTLDDMVVTLTLNGGTYERSVFDIRGAVTVSGIDGVTIPWHDPDRKGDTQITVKLEFDGDIDTDSALTFTIGMGAIANYDGPPLTIEIPVRQVENAQITEPTGLKEDVNNDGVVNIQDLVLVASNLGQAGQNKADVNGDGVVDIRDLVKVAGALGTSAAAPSLHPQALEILTATNIKVWLSQAQSLDLTDATSQKGILFLEQLLTMLIPKETALLANYPNPFNPETWIPYQLSKPAEVTITIYAVNGQVVRTLVLGHQLAGIYQTRSRAAYWDGRNAFGESVASGMYFYTLTADDFTATRKMLIRK